MLFSVAAVCGTERDSAVRKPQGMLVTVPSARHATVCIYYLILAGLSTLVAASSALGTSPMPETPAAEGFGAEHTEVFSVAIVRDDLGARGCEWNGDSEFLVGTESCVRQVNRMTSAVTDMTGVCGSIGFATDTTTKNNHLFSQINDIMFDTSNSWFVAVSSGANQVLLVYTDGTAKLLAGSTAGAAGGNEGTVSTAQFNGPRSVAQFTSTNYLIADPGNHRIRQVTTAGVVTTYGPTGVAGCVDGPNTVASITAPAGIFASATGLMYVATQLMGAIFSVDYSADPRWAMRIGNCSSTSSLAHGPAVNSTAYDRNEFYQDNGEVTLLNPSTMWQSPRGDTLYVSADGDHLVRVEVLGGYRVSLVSPPSSDGGVGEGRLWYGGSVGSQCFSARANSVGHVCCGMSLRDTLVELQRGNTIARYTLGGDAGFDLSGNGHHIISLGAGVAATTNRHGHAAAALSFDGTTNAYLVLPNSVLSGVSSYSICAWAEATVFPGTLLSTATSSTQPFLDIYVQSGSVEHALNGLAHTTSYYNDGSATHNTGWKHYCAWKNGNHIGLTMNGEYLTAMSGELANATRLDPAGIVVGQRQTAILGGYTQSFTGRISDLVVHNYVPSYPELQGWIRETYRTRQQEVWAIDYVGGGEAGYVNNVPSSEARFFSIVDMYRWYYNAGTPTWYNELAVVDRDHHCIRKLWVDGSSSQEFVGKCGTPGHLAGIGTAARLTSPSLLFLDIYYRFYVYSSPKLYQIRYDVTTGTVHLVCDIAVNGAADGDCSAGGQLSSSIVSMTTRTNGDWRYWLPEPDTHTIRQVQASFSPSVHTLSTPFGQSGTAGCVEGIGTAARFTNPTYIHTDTNVRKRAYVVMSSGQGIARIVESTLAMSMVVGSCVAGAFVVGTSWNELGAAGVSKWLVMQRANVRQQDMDSALLPGPDDSKLLRVYLGASGTAYYVAPRRHVESLNAMVVEGRVWHGAYGLSRITVMTDYDRTDLSFYVAGSNPPQVYRLRMAGKRGMLPLHYPYLDSDRAILQSIGSTPTYNGLAAATDHHGRRSQATYFDGGVTTHFSVGSGAFQEHSTFSICVWIMVTAAGSGGTVVSTAQDGSTTLVVGYTSDDHLYAWVGPTASESYQVRLERRLYLTWQFLCFLVNGAHVHLAIDGEILATGRRKGNGYYRLTPSSNIVFGQRVDGGGSFEAGHTFQGSMTMVHLYSYALNTAEMLELIESEYIPEEVWSLRIVAGTAGVLGTNVGGTGSAIQFDRARTALPDHTDTNYLLVWDFYDACIRRVPIDGLSASTTFTGLCGASYFSATFGSASATRLSLLSSLKWNLFTSTYYGGGFVGYYGIIFEIGTDGSSTVICGSSGSIGTTGTDCTGGQVFNIAAPLSFISATKFTVANPFYGNVRLVDGTTVTTIIGSVKGNEEGSGTSAIMSSVTDQVVDSEGNIWVNSGRNALYKISASTYLSTNEVTLEGVSPSSASYVGVESVKTMTLSLGGKSSIVVTSQIHAHVGTDGMLVSGENALVRMQYANCRFSLIGQPTLSAVTTEGRMLYTGNIQSTPYPVYHEALQTYFIVDFIGDVVSELIPGFLRAWFKLHGNTVDAQGRYTANTLGSGVTAVAGPRGVPGTALGFDGTTNAYAVLENGVFERLGSYSVCFWATTADPDVTFFTVSVTTSSILDFVKFAITSGPETLVFQVSQSSTASAAQSMDSNGWFHICGVKDGTAMHVYVDSTEVVSTTGVPTIGMVQYVNGVVLGQTQGTVLGGYSAATALNGAMADLRVYNYGLLPYEVERINVLGGGEEYGSGSVRIIAGDPSTPSSNVASGVGTGVAVAFTEIVAVASLAPTVSTTDLVVADGYSSHIYRVSLAGTVTQLVGASTLYPPRSMALDANNGCLIVVAAAQVYKVHPTTGDATIHAGPTSNTEGYNDATGSAARFKAAGVLVWSATDIIVTDLGNYVRHITNDATLPPASTNNGVVTTSAGDGTASCSTSTLVGTAAKFNQPNDIAVDVLNRMWIVNTGSNAIAHMTTGMAVTYPFGCPGSAGLVDGATTKLRLTAPTTITYDSSVSVMVVVDSRIRGIGIYSLVGQSITTPDRETRNYREGRLLDGGASHIAGRSAFAKDGVLYGGGHGVVVELVRGQLLTRYRGMTHEDSSGNNHHITTDTLTSYGTFEANTDRNLQIPNSVIQSIHSYTICMCATIASSSSALLSIATSTDVRAVELLHVEGTTMFRHTGKQFTVRDNPLTNLGDRRLCVSRNGDKLQMFNNGEAIQSYPPVGAVPAGGRVTSLGFVLGQSQGSVLGSFVSSLTLAGRVSEFLVANYGYNAEEASDFSCSFSTTRSSDMTASATSTNNQSPTPVLSSSHTSTQSLTSAESSTSSPSATSTLALSLTSSESLTPAPSATSAPSASLTTSQSPSLSGSPTTTYTESSTSRPTTTAVPSASLTPSGSLSPAASSSVTPTATATAVLTLTSTATPTSAPTDTAQPTSTGTVPDTRTSTTTPTIPPTSTMEPTASLTPQATDTAAPTATQPHTVTAPATASQDATETVTFSSSISMSRVTRTRTRVRTLTRSRPLTVTKHYSSLTAAASETLVPPIPTMQPLPPPTAVPTQPSGLKIASISVARAPKENVTKPGGVVTVDVVVTPAPVTSPFSGVEVLVSFSGGKFLRGLPSSGSCAVLGRTGSVVRCRSGETFTKNSHPFRASVSVLLSPTMSLPVLLSVYVEGRIDSSRAPFGTASYSTYIPHTKSVEKKYVASSKPLNDVTFGSNVTLSVGNADNWPEYAFVGPYIAKVTVVDDNTVTIHIPVPSKLFPNNNTTEPTDFLACPRAFEGVEDLVQQLIDSPDISAWATALPSSVWDETTWALDYGCDKNNGVLDPSDFTISPGGIKGAPNHDGINMSAVPDGEAGVAADTMESGSITAVDIVVPNTGPVVSNTTSAPVLANLTGANAAGPVRRLPRSKADEESNTLRYRAFVDVLPKNHSDVVFLEAILKDEQYLREWKVSKTCNLSFPTVGVDYVAYEGFTVTVQAVLLSGKKAINPHLVIRGVHKYVSFGYATSCPFCVATDWEVACDVPTLTAANPTSSPFNITFIPPAYFHGAFNATANVIGSNFPLASQDLRAAYDPKMLDESYSTRRPTVAPTAAPPTPSPPVSLSNIFGEHDGGLHFVVYTMIAYLVGAAVLTIVQQVLKAKGRFTYDFTRVTLRDAVVTRHTWISIFRPCHYRCLVVHLTGIMAKVFGLYMWCSLAEHLVSQLPSVHFVLAGFVAAVCQAAQAAHVADVLYLPNGGQQTLRPV